ncbi:MAG: DsrE family protein [Planctomycetota bacterium]|jgi:hypothetical protein
MQDTVILVTRLGFGTTGPDHDEFGRQMLDKFFHTIEKQPKRPAAICFYTEGVRCVVDGSPVLLGLQLLAGMDVRVVSCATCLEEYGLRDRVAVGEVGGMDEIVRLIGAAAKVVTV